MVHRFVGDMRRDIAPCYDRRRGAPETVEQPVAAAHRLATGAAFYQIVSIFAALGIIGQHRV